MTPRQTSLRVALFLAATILLLAVASALAPHNASRDLATAALAAAGTWLLTAAFAHWDHLSLAAVGAAPSRHTLPRLALGLLLGLALVALQMLAVFLTGHVHWQRSAITSLVPILLSTALYSLAGLREELAFRGYPLRRLDSLFGPWPALLLLAVVFVAEHAAAHYPWPSLLLGVLPGALLFGAAALATRGLALPLGIHLAWNLGSWAIGNKDIPGLLVPTIDAGYASQANWIGLAAFAATTIALTILLMQRTGRTPSL